MSNTSPSPPYWVAVTLAAGLVSLVVLTVPSLAAGDDGRRVDVKEARSSAGVRPDWMPNDPRRTRHQGDRLRPPDRPHFRAPPGHVRRFDRGMMDRAPSLERSPSTRDGSPEDTQIALVGLASAIIAAAFSWGLATRRRRQAPLGAALASSDPDDLPRVAGLLGDRFVQQSHTGAAEHAYRAAIDVGDQYWSPIAQVALANLLSDLDQRANAEALLEAVIASGHPRAVLEAQASLDQLLTGLGHNEAASCARREAYETLG